MLIHLFTRSKNFMKHFLRSLQNLDLCQLRTAYFSESPGFVTKLDFIGATALKQFKCQKKQEQRSERKKREWGTK